MLDGKGITDFMAGFGLTALTGFTVVMLITHFRKSAWAKIVSVLAIFVIIVDFLINKGQTVSSLVKTLANKLLGTNF